MRAWAKAYEGKAYYLTAVRSTAKGTGDRKLDVPAIRLSFQTPQPVLPYTEAAVDVTDETAYTGRYNPHQPYRGYSYGMRPFDVYVVAAHQMQAVAGQTTAGPNVADAMRATSDAIAGALGDTKSWGFDPLSRPTWVVTHLSENVWQRTTQSDLVFQRYDLPKPRPGPGVTEADDRPEGPTFPGSSMEWLGEPTAGKPPASHHAKLLHLGAIALFLLIAGAAAFAVASEQGATKAKP